MKKGLKKILAVVLTLAVLLCSGASLSANAYYINYDVCGEFKLSGTYYGAPGEITPFDLVDPGVEYDEYYVSVVGYVVGCVYDDDYNVTGFESYCNGVDIINVYFYNDSEMVADLYYLFVSTDGEDLGELTYATAYNVDANYKQEGYLDIYLDYETEETPYYCVLVDDMASPISFDGEYYFADEVGSGVAIVYIVDAAGNVFATCIDVNVNYTFFQWIIRILLFGWLWY